MGNTDSNTNNNNTNSHTPYMKTISRYNLHQKISKTDIINIFKKCDMTFVNILCQYFIPNDDYITEEDFDYLIENFHFKSCEKFMRFLIKICKIDKQISSHQLKLLFKWISFSASDDFCDILLNSYAKSFPNNNEFDIDDLVSWLDRNCSDLAIDFCCLIYNLLSSDSSNGITNDYDITLKCYEVIEHLKSSILDLSELFILYSCLPIRYKTSDCMETFYFQNSKHWFMLYNSNSHGLSASKFKETSFDYTGPLLVIFKSVSGIYCLATDVGLKEDWNCYGGVDCRFMQLRPFYQKYLSGSRSQNSTNQGIIYSHFSAKSGRRGLFVGHSPLKSPALEVNEDFSVISVLGGSQQLVAVEVWAVGSDVTEKTAKLKDIRNWENKEVDKHKNRKLKQETWEDSPDRMLLDWGGVNTRNKELAGKGD